MKNPPPFFLPSPHENQARPLRMIQSRREPANHDEDGQAGEPTDEGTHGETSSRTTIRETADDTII